MSKINQWANFLRNEKLDPEHLDNASVENLMTLAFTLAEKRSPKIGSHADKMESRRLVCTTAFDLGINLLAMKKRKFQGRGSKPAIGRGLLDVWNEEYKKHFGGTVGTPGASEVIRRTIVGKLSIQRMQEKQAEFAAAMIEGKSSAKQLVERFGYHLSYVQNKMQHMCACQNGMVGTAHCLVHGDT